MNDGGPKEDDPPPEGEPEPPFPNTTLMPTENGYCGLSDEEDNGPVNADSELVDRQAL